MVKVLSRDAVQRMTGRRSSSAVNIGGGSGDASGVSRAWVEENYISKAFFETLFTIHGTKEEDGVTTDVVITPNDTETTLKNIQAMVGLWTNSYLSALGLNPGGGGGGGATALTELVDVTISNPQNGQALIYNSTAGKWVNGDITPDLSDYATKQWVQQGYLPLTGGTMQNTTLVTNLNADMLDGRHGDDYAMIGVLGTIIEQETDLNDILNSGTYTCQSGADALTLSNTPYTGGNFRLWHIVNTGTDGNTGQQWSSQIMLAPNEARMFIRSHNTNAFGEWKEFAYLTSNVASATKLQTPHTIWGQNFDGTNNVSGLINNASGIKLNQTGNGFGYIDFHYASSSAYTSNIYEKSSGLLVINDLLNIIKGGNVGINTASPSYKLHVSGTFHASGNSSIGGTLGVTGATTLSSTLGVTGLLTANGGITIPSGKTLTIGDAVLSWDSTNQGIKITKGLYSETFISALGANSGGGGGGGGSVTSVAMSVPTGFSISGSPITTSGTLALSFAAGYSLPATAKQNQWDAKQDAISDLATIRSNASHGQTAYEWGNHANAGYATQTWVTDKGYITSSALTGYATQQWVQQGYVTIETAQTVSGNKTFSGTITPTGGIVPRAIGNVNTHNAADNSKLVIKQASASVDETPNNGLVFEWGTSNNWVGQLYFGDNGTQGLYWGGWTSPNNVLTRNEWVKLAFVTDNVASATKLQTARTIWGQSFDGTGNVSGAITGATTISASSNVSVGGTLGVTGATTLSSTLGVSGLITANGGITIPSGKTLTISNTALVTNLNADMLDGRHGDGYAVIGVMGTRIEQETDLNDILNAGTYTCISGADALTLDNTPYTGGNFRLWHIVNTGTDGNTGQQWSSQIMLAPNEARMFIRSHSGSSFGEWKEFAYLTSNVASATKLQTARTIWGQSFDGTGNVSGDITDAGNIFAKGDYLLLSSGKSKYGLMVESTSWGENRDCAFGFHDATSGHSIAWSTRSGQNDICLDLVIDPNNTVAKRYTRVYDALCIGDAMIVWDSANNALKVIKINGDAANFYATGGVSALGIS